MALAPLNVKGLHYGQTLEAAPLAEPAARFVRAESIMVALDADDFGLDVLVASFS